MSESRDIQGVWLIERNTGRNLISKAYSGIEIDMDLIAPFLSATHTFIDKASHENLKTIDTENNRYVWEATDDLLFVMVVSKGARLSHMRFLVEYALKEFMKNEIPKDQDLDSLLKTWTGTSKTFKRFGNFVDELINQYEFTDEALIAGKAMDCLEVYSHLIKSILSVDINKKTRTRLTETILKRAKYVVEKFSCLAKVPIDENGIDVLCIDVYNTSYRQLRNALEELLKVVAVATKEISPPDAFKEMIFEEAMPYVKRDISRLQTYAILDDVVRYLF
ncbi:hypothetical protein EU537_01750 [Candidatus Thorarchaeota archaeon]|nr:MAG: hypothetical protein EU537_01750 [Candidatus Thorarchaeota archaeon]